MPIISDSGLCSMLQELPYVHGLSPVLQIELP